MKEYLKMKACLIWDHTEGKPPVGPALLNRAPHIQYLPEAPGISQALRQLDREHPELVFLAASAARPDYGALLRTVKARDPGCFLIALGGGPCPGLPQKSRPDLTLPAMWTEKQLLDGVFQAELDRAGIEPGTDREQAAEQELPDPKAFLEELDRELYKFPDQVRDRHWQQLEQWIERDVNAAGWHLVSLASLMMEKRKDGDGGAAELRQACIDALRVLSGGPSASLWKSAYERMCTLYIQLMLTEGDPAGRETAKIKQYIDEHIEEDVSLKRVAQEFFLSTSYLSRLFKSKAGVNFSDYISMRKIERAKTLLAETDLTVAEISRRLNYPEQNSFSRFFKGKVGVPPQTYRVMNAAGPKERAAEPEPVLEDFEITDFGPCAFTSEDYSFAYSFRKRR